MKKYLSIICAITMLACLGGCGSSDSDSKSSSETSSSSEKEETTEEKTDKETEKPTEKETEPETTKATEPATEPEKTDDSPVKILSHSLSKDYEGKDILDVACGTGFLINYYLKRNARFVTGVDLSDKMCEIASKNILSK